MEEDRNEEPNRKHAGGFGSFGGTAKSGFRGRGRGGMHGGGTHSDRWAEENDGMSNSPAIQTKGPGWPSMRRAPMDSSDFAKVYDASVGFGVPPTKEGGESVQTASEKIGLFGKQSAFESGGAFENKHPHDPFKSAAGGNSSEPRTGFDPFKSVQTKSGYDPFQSGTGAVTRGKSAYDPFKQTSGATAPISTFETPEVAPYNPFQSSGARSKDTPYDPFKTAATAKDEGHDPFKSSSGAQQGYRPFDSSGSGVTTEASGKSQAVKSANVFGAPNSSNSIFSKISPANAFEAGPPPTTTMGLTQRRDSGDSAGKSAAAIVPPPGAVREIALVGLPETALDKKTLEAHFLPYGKVRTNHHEIKQLFPSENSSTYSLPPRDCSTTPRKVTFPFLSASGTL